MADSGPGIAGPLSGDPAAASSDGRMGMLALNDLVYKLNPDLSVAVNRTHKVMFPQTQEYSNDQTTMFIINSGADYVDPANSSLFFQIELEPQKLTRPTGRTPAATVSLNDTDFDFDSPVMNFYFGPHGSILNLIDQVNISSRSGEELSRITNYGQLMNVYLPMTFGQDWKGTIGSNMAMGSYIGAHKTSNPSRASDKNEQRRRAFQIPLYLLSPFFNYSRLLPSMIMSGLKIEIRWKPLDVATQQFWTGAPKYLSASQETAASPLYNDAKTEFATFLSPNDLLPANPKFPLCIHEDSTGNAYPFPMSTVWSYQTQVVGGYDLDKEIGVIFAQRTAGGGAILFDEIVYTESMVGASSPLLGQNIFRAGTILALPMDSTKIDNDAEDLPEDDGKADGERAIELARRARTAAAFAGSPGNIPIWWKYAVIDCFHGGLIVQPLSSTTEFSLLETDGTLGPETGAKCGAVLLYSPAPMVYQSKPGEYIYSGIAKLPSTPVTKYTIKNISISLACTTLTDAIQRALNEFSAVNGLEIVYSDFSCTTSPFVTFGESNPVYLELRQSASRALMAFARVIETSPNPHMYDSFASCQYSWWNKYQVQLGSLYFPQQSVEDGNADPELRRDNVAVQAYTYALDAFNRLHPKAAPTMMSLRGDESNVRLPNYHPVGSTAQHEEDAYLMPPSLFGKWGSYVNGAYTVATTLERSSAFDLSGVPTNNSRVLALRGDVGFNVPLDKLANFRAAIFACLKYVRLARVFLLNTEVEQ